MSTITAPEIDDASLHEALVPRLKSLALLASQAGASLGFSLPGKPTNWLSEASGCSCADSYGEPDTCSTCRVCERFEIAFSSTPIGFITLCVPRGAEKLLISLRDTALTAVRCVELERGEEGLLHELSTAWESLEAVCEVSAGLRSLEDTSALLDRIMSRAVSMQDGLQAVLWLQRNGRLEPVAARCQHACEARDFNGLLGQALAEHAGIILNDPARIAEIPDLEPELRKAHSVVVAPVNTRQGLLGALVIWREESSGAFDSRTMHLAETLAMQAAMVAENDRLHRDTMENERLRQEVEIGSVIQQTLLLGLPPTELQGLRIASLTVPSALVDGDFCDFFRHDPETLDVIIGDVMGKGVPAALVGAATKNELLRALSRLLGDGQRPPAVTDIVAAAHNVVVPQLIDLERFVTLCYARFEAKTRQMTLVDCGHTRTVHYRSRDGSVALLQGQDTPLGFCIEPTYQPVTIPFEPGDVFFFYSDGLTESRSPNGELFGETRLADVIRAYGNRSSAVLIEQVRQSVVSFSTSSSFADDLTCVVVQITPPVRRIVRELPNDLACLTQVRDFINEACTGLPEGKLDPETLGCFILAANEAASNVIRHAYDEADRRHPVQLAADIFDDRLEIILRHRGRSFVPAPGQDAAPTAPRTGGLGLFIIRQFTDKVDYNVDALGYAYTRLIKHLGQ